MDRQINKGRHAWTHRPALDQGNADDEDNDTRPNDIFSWTKSKRKPSII